jgi:PIN like domain
MSMKSILPEWYAPDDETIQKVLEEGTIALDTNALLDLYRVGREQREEILSVLRDSRERLFVPYQVSFEFLRRRLDVVAGIEAAYESILDSVQVKPAQLQQIRDLDIREQVEKLSQRAHKSFANGLEKLREAHTISFKEAREDDPVQQALDELLEPPAQLGQEPSEDELADRRAEADRRRDGKIPPGFADKGKDDASGDYLIWAELLDHAEQSDRPLLFVTNDERKGDWYREFRGQTIGPCIELIVEIRSVTTHPYHQTNLSSFLFLAKKYLGAKVDDETIATVKNIPRENVPSVAQGLASEITSNPSRGWVGDQLRHSGIGSIGDLGKNYFSARGIESPFTPLAQAAYPSAFEAMREAQAAYPSAFEAMREAQAAYPSAFEAMREAETIRRELMHPWYQPSAQPRYDEHRYSAAPAPQPSEQLPAPTSAKKVAKKAPAKKEPAKKAPAKAAATKASPAAKASEGKKTRRAK